MEENEEITQKLEKAYQQVEEHLEEGVIYYSTPAVTKYGTSGGGLFTIEDGKRAYFDREKVERLDLFDVTTTFPEHTIVRYTFQKGQPVTVEASSPEMLIEEMKLTMKARQLQRVEMLKVLNEPEEADLMKIETHVKFLKKGKMDVLEKQVTAGGKESENDYSCAEKEIEALYKALDGKIQKMYIELDGDTLKVQTTPAIPGLTSEVLEKQADLTLDTSNLEAIYAFMESHDEAKMAKAVEVLKENPAFLEKAEKRYLHFVRARLNDTAATLDKFPEAALRKVEVNTLLGKNFAKDFISLSYFDDAQSKLTVDFIGSMVQSAIDLDVFIDLAVKSSTVKALMMIYDVYAARAKNAILAEAKIHPEGWYAKISTHLINLELRKVLFEKTQFDEANRSLALKGFMFFLNINCPYAVYLDIFQSDEPNLTEMFWLLKAVPDSSWGDTTPKFPDSPLKMVRSASYRIGDEGDWEDISKP